MGTDKSTITERLNQIADELEDKAKMKEHTKPAQTVSEALDRVAEAVKKLPPKPGPETSEAKPS